MTMMPTQAGTCGAFRPSRAGCGFRPSVVRRLHGLQEIEGALDREAPP